MMTAPESESTTRIWLSVSAATSACRRLSMLTSKCASPMALPSSATCVAVAMTQRPVSSET